MALSDASVARFMPALGVKREVAAGSARDILEWQPRAPEEAIVSEDRSLIDLGVV